MFVHVVKILESHVEQNSTTHKLAALDIAVTRVRFTGKQEG